MVTLRHWEEAGVLEPPPRIGGKRRYGESILTRIAIIDLARAAGFRLEEIRELLVSRAPGQAPGERWRSMAARKHAELDELLTAVQAAQALLTHLADCRCPTLDDCVTDPTAVYGDHHGQVRTGSGAPRSRR